MTLTSENPFFVPTVEQWAAMSGHQRRAFCARRMPVRLVLIECEKPHREASRVPDRSSAGVFSAEDLARLRAALIESEVRANPHPDADRHWNDLAIAVGALNEIRPEIARVSRGR